MDSIKQSFAIQMVPTIAATGASGFSSLASQILKYAVITSAILAVVFIVVGGIMYMTAGGNTSQTTKAKGLITSALIGLLLVAGSYLLLKTINPDLVNMNLGITPLQIHIRTGTPVEDLYTQTNNINKRVLSGEQYDTDRECQEAAHQTCGNKFLGAVLQNGECSIVCVKENAQNIISRQFSGSEYSTQAQCIQVGKESCGQNLISTDFFSNEDVYNPGGLCTITCRK